MVKPNDSQQVDILRQITEVTRHMEVDASPYRPDSSTSSRPTYSG